MTEHDGNGYITTGNGKTNLFPAMVAELQRRIEAGEMDIVIIDSAAAPDFAVLEDEAHRLMSGSDEARAALTELMRAGDARLARLRGTLPALDERGA